jgi:SAM-dependent methyltransferase
LTTKESDDRIWIMEKGEETMAQADLAAEIDRLRIQLQVFSVIGAALRLRRDGATGDPRVTTLIDEVIKVYNPTLLDGIDTAQAGTWLANVRRQFIEGFDLVNSPDRQSGWSQEDPELLQAVGTMSAATVGWFKSAAATRPGFAAAIGGDATFLDIGTGVAGIAIEAARSWPAMKAVGLEIWPPSLALARANIDASGMGDRIELRNQNVMDLDDREAFSLIWLPAPCISGEVVTAVLPRLRRALRPGGYLVFNTVILPADPLAGSIARLRIAQLGGHPWTASDAVDQLRGLGLEDIDIVPPFGAYQMIIGRRALV